MTALRIGYTCHDRFPSTDTNTQQIFWTLSEVARLGHAVDLRVRALEPADDVRALMAAYYGAPAPELPATFRISADRRPFRHVGIDTIGFDLRAPRRFRRATHDVVWTRDPLALVAAMRSGVPAVFETFRPDFAESTAFVLWRLMTIRRGGWGTARAPRLAGVIAHSTLAASAFVRAGVPESRCLVAHNGHAPSLMEPEMPVAEARVRAGLPDDRPLLVYTGHVGPHKGTGALFDLARALPDVSVVIVGVDESSGERQWIVQQLAARGIGNVVLVPRVGLADVATYLYAADCLVIPPTGEPLTRYRRTVLPMKLFSYLAAGRPILAPRLPDVEEVLRDGDTALLVDPGDPLSAAAAVRRLLGDPPLQARLSHAAREASRRYTWAARARVIVEALDRWLTV